MSFLKEHCSLFSVNEPKELGSDVLDFIKLWFIEPLNKTGCRFVIVDAYKTRPKLKHIYFVAETKGYDKDSLKDYRRAESVKIECASRHFATISDSHVTYDVVKNYDELWNIITKP